MGAFKKYGPSRNLFNMDESAQGDGYTANGVMTSTGIYTTNAFFISEYIPVIPGQIYTYFTDLFRSGQAVIKFYNIVNGTVTYLDQTPQKNISSSVSYSPSECVTFTVPTNTSRVVTHIRINVDRESTMFFIVEGSTAPTEYIPYGNIWQSINPKQLKGIPYTGTLPAVLAGTKAGYLHKYKIYGNLSQNGTPTPENPIVPSECGERTENLCDGIDVGASINSSGTITRNDDRWLVYYAPVESGKSYVYRASAGSVYAFYQTKPTQGATSYDGNRYSSSVANPTFIAEIDGYVAFRIGVNELPMFNAGQIALPYEPYGYKLPLTSGSTPVDIYLGESQTTRRVRKLVLTGEENWKKYSASYPSHFIISNAVNGRLSGIAPLCTHYKGSTATNYSGLGVNCISVSTATVSGEQSRLTICDTAYTDLADWKTYLAQQYANGTPVTVWYVLASEETTTLNEPLRKIGDYADTIDSTQTSAQIPTLANSTTISWAGQGLAPSEFDSIQEWVDIPTYKRVNGEWVEDN